VIHILKPGAPQYDVSFSDPTLPFSVFVGVHRESDAIQDLRLAESILHECMHLQLTLIESQTRLLDTDNELHLSPWRQTLRPTRGILHALYVFRVIQDFFRALRSSASMASAERAHIQSRLSEIEAEVDRLGDFSSSNDLTPIGRALAKRLLVGNWAPA
jgi:HEXXH motif-containing protein